MNKNLLSCLLLVLLLLLPLPTSAQTAGGQGGESREQASVTFTFNAACEDCGTQSAAGRENLYLIDVPLSNNPSPAKSGAAGDLNLEVRVTSDRLVYAIPFKSGTSPRAVWRNGGRVLQVFFVPAGAGSATSARRGDALPPPPDAETRPGSPVGSRAAAGAPPTPVVPAPRADAPPAPQGLGSLAGLLPLIKPVDRDAKGSTKLAAVDLSVPESPGFTVLGLTPQTVVRPTSPRQFASSLLSGVDTNGNFQSGLALDFVPYLVFAGDELTLRGYQQSYLQRLLSRTQVSFATTKGASDDDKSMRLALGFHATLWDKGDPRTDEKLMTCLGTFLQLPSIPIDINAATGNCELPDNPTPEDRAIFRQCQETTQAAQDQRARQIQELTVANDAVSDRCRNESRQRNWNRSSWIIAGAPSWISTDGKTSNYRFNGGGLWTSLAYGFEGVQGLEDRSQLILHARYRNREQVPDPDNEGSFFSQDSMFFGARFRHGSPLFNGSFEYTFLRSRPAGKSFDNSQRLAVGLERRIAGDTWFNLSLGADAGRADGRNNGFVLTSFKWGFSERRNAEAPK